MTFTRVNIFFLCKFTRFILLIHERMNKWLWDMALDRRNEEEMVRDRRKIKIVLMRNTNYDRERSQKKVNNLIHNFKLQNAYFFQIWYFVTDIKSIYMQIFVFINDFFHSFFVLTFNFFTIFPFYLFPFFSYILRFRLLHSIFFYSK